MLSSMLSHLKKAKESLISDKETFDIQQKVESKVTQEIKKVAEEIKTQTREEIAVKAIKKIKEVELKRKKDLEDEISKLEFKMQV